VLVAGTRAIAVSVGRSPLLAFSFGRPICPESAPGFVEEAVSGGATDGLAADEVGFEADVVVRGFVAVVVALDVPPDDDPRAAAVEETFPGTPTKGIARRL
jgi:hypothetical protein